MSDVTLDLNTNRQLVEPYKKNLLKLRLKRPRKNRAYQKIEHNTIHTEPIINGSSKVRVSENTDATPLTSVGSPA